MFASWKIGVNHTHTCCVSFNDGSFLYVCVHLYIYINYKIFMYSYLYLDILAYYLHITLMISINLFPARGAFITQDCTDGMHWNLCGSESNTVYIHTLYI